MNESIHGLTAIHPPGNFSFNDGGDEAGESKNMIYFFLAINCIFAFFGSVGNICAAVVLSFGKQRSNHQNLFLLNLAIADLCVLVISFPVLAVKWLSGNNWPLGEPMCKLLSSSADFFHIVSLATIVAIAIARYHTIVHSMDAKWTLRRIRLIILFIWVFSFVAESIPSIMSYQLYEQKYKIMNETRILFRVCSHDAQSTMVAVDNIVETFVWYFIPLLIILLTFLRIHFFLKEHMRQSSVHQTSSNIQTRYKKLRKVTKMLAVVVFCFALLMLPWNIIKLLEQFTDLRIEETHRKFAATFLVLNSCVNPFIYYMMSAEFRMEFKKQIIRLKLRMRESVLSVQHHSSAGSDGTQATHTIRRRIEPLDWNHDDGGSGMSIVYETLRKRSLMDGYICHDIKDVVSVLHKCNNNLEETLL
ncbi:neuropeptide Y receptor type 4-like [Clytia hemisphaerica]